VEPSLDWVLSLRDVLLSSLRSRRLPLPLDREVCDGWRRDLSSGGGPRALYTSCMYQLAPALRKAVEGLEKFGAARGGLRARLAALGAKTAGGLMLRPEREELERAYRILRNIYYALRHSGVEFRLLDDEPYSGALLYELGFEDDFAEYAREVYRYFKERDVKEVITVDPHTNYVLERVYPSYVDGFDISVVSYLDLLDAGKIRVKISGFAIHDSCLYARFLGRYERVRQLLAAGGPVENPYITGKETAGCCGGPVESIVPNLAAKIAFSRAQKLATLSRTVVSACPICLANLSRTGIVEVKDVAEVVEL